MACEARQIKSLRCGGVGRNGGVCRPKQGWCRRARYRIPSGTPASASFRRRRALLVVIPSEVPAPAPFSRRRAHSKDGIPSEVPAPARIRRRRAHLVRNSVGNLPSGAVFSPEGALSQLRRTRTSFRRLSLAEGLALAETCNEVSPPASPGNKALGTATSSASQTSRCLPQGPTALHRARCPGATPSPWAKGSRKGSPPP